VYINSSIALQGTSDESKPNLPLQLPSTASQTITFTIVTAPRVILPTVEFVMYFGHVNSTGGSDYLDYPEPCRQFYEDPNTVNSVRRVCPRLLASMLRAHLSCLLSARAVMCCVVFS
jgi:hypothetical protein